MDYLHSVSLENAISVLLIVAFFVFKSVKQMHAFKHLIRFTFVISSLKDVEIRKHFTVANLPHSWAFKLKKRKIES